MQKRFSEVLCLLKLYEFKEAEKTSKYLVSYISYLKGVPRDVTITKFLKELISEDILVIDKNNLDMGNNRYFINKQKLKVCILEHEDFIEISKFLSKYSFLVGDFAVD